MKWFASHDQLSTGKSKRAVALGRIEQRFTVYMYSSYIYQLPVAYTAGQLICKSTVCVCTSLTRTILLIRNEVNITC